jgi:hypothetical protein
MDPFWSSARQPHRARRLKVTMVHTYLLGFDARIAWSLLPPPLAGAKPEDDVRVWSGLRRPFSVDARVWPSIFEEPERAALPLQALREGGLAEGLATPRWIGGNRPCWDDLRAMRAAVEAQHAAAPSRYNEIAITWHEDDPQYVEAYNVGPHALPTSPPALDASRRLLGYDVAEAARDDSIVWRLGRRKYGDWDSAAGHDWRRGLDSHGLFGTPDPAWALVQTLRDHSDDRIPVCVFGLWLIRRVRRRAG